MTLDTSLPLSSAMIYSETMKVIEDEAQLNPHHHHDLKEIVVLRIRASLYNSILLIARFRVYKVPRRTPTT